jgi:uncharacterized protein with GYD domain
LGLDAGAPKEQSQGAAATQSGTTAVGNYRGRRQISPVGLYDREDHMATYVLLSVLTPEGGHTLHAHPERMVEVNQEINEFGCAVVSQYALLGPYDFLTVVEAPDNETIAHLSVDLGSRGTVKVTTFPAMPIDGFVEKLKGPKQIGRS